MTPFDINPDNDAGHALDQDDLIAFHLHELTPPQERAFHRVLRTNPALQAESIAIATTLHAFPKHEPLPSTLDPTAASARIWQTLGPNLTPYIPTAATPPSLFKLPFALPFSNWAIPTVAGAVLATTALVLALHHHQPSSPSTVATTNAPTPNPSTPPSPTSTTESLPPTTPTSTTTSSSTIPIASRHLPWTLNAPQSAPSAPTEAPQPAPLEATLPPTAPPPSATQPTAPPSSTQASPLTSAPTTTEASTSQPTNTSTPPSPTQLRGLRQTRIHHPHPTDLTLAIFGDLTPSTTSTYNSTTGAPLTITSRLPITQSAVGILASFHQQFNPWLGYRITTTYAHPTLQYTYNSSSALTGVIQQSDTVTDSVYELSGSYVALGPHPGRLTTSAEAGAGLLAFLPNSNSQAGTATRTLRPAATVGISADIALTKHWSLHTGYRALLYNSPTFHTTTVATSPTFTFSSNPIVGVTYNFGARGSD